MEKNLTYERTPEVLAIRRPRSRFEYAIQWIFAGLAAGGVMALVGANPSGASGASRAIGRAVEATFRSMGWTSISIWSLLAVAGVIVVSAILLGGAIGWVLFEWGFRQYFGRVRIEQNDSAIRIGGEVVESVGPSQVAIEILPPVIKGEGERESRSRGNVDPPWPRGLKEEFLAQCQFLFSNLNHGDRYYVWLGRPPTHLESEGADRRTSWWPGLTCSDPTLLAAEVSDRRAARKFAEEVADFLGLEFVEKRPSRNN